jgi:acyl dehydratase
VTRLAEVREGQELPEVRRIVTREDLKAYADAGGDQNPLHQDDAFARSAGFPGVIAHGMFTMGHLAACVASWAGDATAVESLSANFRAPVFVGEEIVAGGRVRSVDATSGVITLETWVSVERQGVTEWPIRRGEARVRLT